MELQLKHLAPYLPYELKWNVKTIDGPFEATMTTIYDDGCIALDPFYDFYINSNENDFIAKPALLPLSCLTEEITVDGETFVPIVELAKIHDGFSDWFFVEPNKAVSQGWNFYYNMEEKEFQLRFQGQRGFPNNIYEIYLKIHEWHFDVFNLIDAGLAIDKRKHLNR